MEAPLGAGFAGSDLNAGSTIDQREGLKPRN
jgi:hypothetical protein